jgi:hypothetical protein
MLWRSPRCRTGGWSEDPAEEEERPADLCRLINLRFDQLALRLAAGYGLSEEKAAKGPPARPGVGGVMTSQLRTGGC